MKLVGVLCWFDESPSWLATAVAGFGRVCDHIVAVDGAYGLYPGARARSRPDQAEAILMAAEAAGCGATVHQPQGVFWGNEVEKRNLALGLAAPLHPDWVLVFDADMHVLQVNAPEVRRDLEDTDLNVATYTILDGVDLLATEAADTAASFPLSTEWTLRTRLIYRWLPELRYGPAHYSVSGLVDDERVWLRGGETCEEPLHLEAGLVVNHRRTSRARVRQDAHQGYLDARDRAGVEHVENIDLLVI